MVLLRTILPRSSRQGTPLAQVYACMRASAKALFKIHLPLLVPLLAAAQFVGCGVISSSQSTPSPPLSGSGANGEINFAKLITALPQGRAKRIPWVGYWWPYSDGGVSSSAVLYESASGKTGAVSWENTNHGPDAPGIQQWWGHCNGWAAAAALFNEPRSPTVQNSVTFSIADQKALLSEVAMEVDADFFGQRDDSDDPTNKTFQDIFPDQFFLVLTNYIGNGLQLVMDRYTGSQVWNQPIVAYLHSPVSASDVLPPDPSAPDVTRVNVTTQVWWARDDVAPDTVTDTFGYQDNGSFQSRILRYEVWLDGPVSFDDSGKMVGSGNVILAKSGTFVTGGAWMNGNLDLMNSHPDYLWAPHAAAPSKGFSNPKIDLAWVKGHFSR